MGDPQRDFFADLERQLVDATRTDNVRRRRRTVVRRGAPILVAAGIAALALGVAPGQHTPGGPLTAVAQAAETGLPAWSSAQIWNYQLDTSVADSGARSSGSYALSTVRRSGANATVEERRAVDQPIAVSNRDLSRRFDALASEELPSRPARTRQDGDAFAELPVPADAFPTTVDGVQRLVQNVRYGATCGEKAMHLAADVLRVPGIAPAARRAMVETIGRCPDVRVTPDARDPLDRPGTQIAVDGTGSGIDTVTELVLDSRSGEPLSLLARAAADAPSLDIEAGGIINADLYRYDR